MLIHTVIEDGHPLKKWGVISLSVPDNSYIFWFSSLRIFSCFALFDNSEITLLRIIKTVVEMQSEN